MPRLKNLSNVNIGSQPNDGTGDLVRDAFVKINTSINAVYNNGQFLSYSPDTKLTPGFTWVNDRDTGMYRPASGKIAFSLNGQESLVLSEDAKLTWFNSEVATKTYVDSQLLEYLGSLPGATLDGPGQEDLQLTSSNSATNTLLIISDEGGNVLANTRVTISGISAVSKLPTVGNYEGRTSFYLGDVWIYSGYPAGNGIGLAANPEIARAAGSDFRWVRFRGTTGITFGATLPSVGFEGQQFYVTSTDTLYYYLEGAWKTAAAVVSADSPTGIDILTTVPPTNSPDNYSGRTIAVGNTIYIFVNGAWRNLNTYSTASGSGITSGENLPPSSGRSKGELFRKIGSNAGLYIHNGSVWVKIESYTNSAATAGIRTLSSLPVDVANYTAGDLVLVNGEVYILNQAKNRWDLFRIGAAGAVTNVQVSANAIDTTKLANAAVTSIKIATNTITSTNLSPGAVTRTKISNGAVGTNQLASNAVSSVNISTGAVTTEHLGVSAVANKNISDLSVSTGKIQNGAVTSSKIFVNSLGSITQNAGNITSGVFKSADNKMVIDLNNKIFRLEI